MTGNQPDESGSLLWRAVGNLEANVNRLLEGQQKLESSQQQLQQEVRDSQQQLREEVREFQQEVRDSQQQLRQEVRVAQADTNRRVDRLLYAVLGVGGGVIALLAAALARGGL